MKPTKEGAALLRRVIKRIQEEPSRFDMDSWGHKDLGMAGPTCGTVACIAGWCVLDGISSAALKKFDSYSLAHQIGDVYSAAVERIVGSDEISDEILDHLFYADEWPDSFRTAYYAAETPAARVKVAVARIRHFIKTGE